jgi:hypothetical protein
VLAAPLVADWLNRDAARKADLAARRTEFSRLSRDWAALHRTHIAHRQRDCRILASFLRRPAAVRAAMAVIAVAPHVAKPFIKHFWNSGKGLEAEAGIDSRMEQNAGFIFANRSEGPAPRIEKDCS